jgi:hypothetical protein
MEREHKEDYTRVCLQKGWKNQLPSAKFESKAGMEPPAHAGGQHRPAFSLKAFVQHLVNFVIADDQVSKLYRHLLLSLTSI